MAHAFHCMLPFLSVLIHTGHTRETPRAVLTLQSNWPEIYQGETFTLRCDIQEGGATDWEYRWFKNKDLNSSVYSSTENEYRLGEGQALNEEPTYSCMGVRRTDSQNSSVSEDITVTVLRPPNVVLRVSPAWWLKVGDSVTLSCEVWPSTPGWRFSWYRVAPYTVVPYSWPTRSYELLPDSERGAGGSYSLSSVGLNHTGGYVCRAGRGDPVYYTDYNKYTSSPTSYQLLWVAGLSPSASLSVSPNTTQHVMDESLSVSCEGQQGNSAGWTVKRISWRGLSDCGTDWGSVTGSTCSSNASWDSGGVYWCESGSGEYSNAVNVTLGSEVILESPALPVTEGDSVTLRCRYKDAYSSPRAEFYREESLVRTESSGEMTILNVSRSDEGEYYCEHPDGERGYPSLPSWLSVRAPGK